MLLVRHQLPVRLRVVALVPDALVQLDAVPPLLALLRLTRVLPVLRLFVPVPAPLLPRLVLLLVVRLPPVAVLEPRPLQ